MNRRRRTRVPFKVRIRLFIDGRPVPARGSRDLSLNGVYLFTKARPPLGTRGAVEIILALGKTRLPLPVRGRVIRQDETGLGLQFEALDRSVFDHLKKVLYYNTGNPEAIDAELIRYPFRSSPGRRKT